MFRSLSANLPSAGRDEIAVLQSSLNGMQDSLRGLVVQVRDSADHIQVANMGELSDADIDSFLQAITAVVQSARPGITEGVARLKSL